MREFGTLDDEPDHCIRGLEHKLHGGSERIKDLKVNAIYAVLKEQSRQRKEASRDAQRIAELYREHVFSSVINAQERGMSDQKNTQTEQKKMTEILMSSSMAFDDFDLEDLKDVDLHDDMDRFEYRMSGLLTLTEVYEELNGRKASRKQSGKMKQIGDALKRRSLSPQRDTGSKVDREGFRQSLTKGR